MATNLEIIQEVIDIDADVNQEMAADYQAEYKALALEIKNANDRRKKIKGIAVELGYGHLVKRAVKEYTVAARVDEILKWGPKD